MVRRAAVETPSCERSLWRLGEPVEEIVDQISLEVADPPYAQLQIDDRVGSSAEIDCGDRERLVHRHHEVACTIDPLPVGHRRGHRVAERNPHILDRVMLIDVEVSRRQQS